MTPRFALKVVCCMVVAGGALAFTLGVEAAKRSSGALDPSFGANGRVHAYYCCADDEQAAAWGSGIATGPDGKIVAVGGLDGPTGQTGSGLAGLTTNGTFDSSFGSGGEVTALWGGAAVAVAIQPNGKVLVTGDEDFGLSRYTTSGDLDPGFGDHGWVQVPFDGDPTGLAIQPDGKIVVAGSSWRSDPHGSESRDFTVARFTRHGKLDKSFGRRGKVLIGFGSSTDDNVSSVAIEPDGKIVVAGTSNAGGSRDFALARLTASGELDPSFGTGGRVLTGFGSGSNDHGTALAIEPHGRIVVSGRTTSRGTPSDFALARYRANGTLDESFGTDGEVRTGFVRPAGATGVALEPNGTIVAVGWRARGHHGAYFVLSRYTTSGGLDPGFGSGGKVLTAFNAGGGAEAVAIQPDGKILVTGESNGGIVVARYLP